jgi:hypothetical protein
MRNGSYHIMAMMCQPPKGMGASHIVKTHNTKLQ